MSAFGLERKVGRPASRGRPLLRDYPAMQRLLNGEGPHVLPFGGVSSFRLNRVHIVGMLQTH